MATLKSVDDKIDNIIRSLEILKDTREGIIKLLEWKSHITEKIEDIENKKHLCLKEKEVYELSTSVNSINKWKWWILGVLVIACSSLVGFSIELSSNYTENKSYITTNKEVIGKLDKKFDTILEKIQQHELKIRNLD